MEQSRQSLLPSAATKRRTFHTMKPPEAFFEEYRKFRERMGWVEASLGRGQDVAQCKLLVEDFREFYQKWHPVLEPSKLCTGLETMRAQIENGLGARLEQIFLAHLSEVVEARKDWWTGEMLFQAAIAFITIMKEAPPQMRPALEQVHREHMKKEYDPETYYRDSEANVAEEEANYRKALAGMEVDWPERVDAALRERLERLDGEGANGWQEELAAQIAAFTPSS